MFSQRERKRFYGTNNLALIIRELDRTPISSWRDANIREKGDRSLARIDILNFAKGIDNGPHPSRTDLDFKGYRGASLTVRYARGEACRIVHGNVPQWAMCFSIGREAAYTCANVIHIGFHQIRRRSKEHTVLDVRDKKCSLSRDESAEQFFSLNKYLQLCRKSRNHKEIDDTFLITYLFIYTISVRKKNIFITKVLWKCQFFSCVKLRQKSQINPLKKSSKLSAYL